MEALLGEISFAAPERPAAVHTIDEQYVRDTLAPVLGDRHLSQYIL